MSDDKEECSRIAAALGQNHVLFMKNHGAVTVGRTIEEAWGRMYYLDVVCRLQLDTLNQKVVDVPHEIALHAYQQYVKLIAGEAEWAPLLRRLLRNHDNGVLRVSGHRV